MESAAQTRSAMALVDSATQTGGIVVTLVPLVLLSLMLSCLMFSVFFCSQVDESDHSYFEGSTDAVPAVVETAARRSVPT